MTQFEYISESLAEMNPEALLADGLEEALIGFTLNHHLSPVAVYDYALCIRVLVDRDSMSEEEADEYLSFNTLGAYVGQNGPIYVSLPGRTLEKTLGPVGPDDVENSNLKGDQP